MLTHVVSKIDDCDCGITLSHWVDCSSLGKRVRIDYQEMLYKGRLSFGRRISSFIS